MLEFETNGKNGHYFLKLPTNLNDFTAEYLNEVTKDIVVAENYSLIGVVYREKLSTIILAARQRKKESNIAVIPIMIRTNSSNNDMFQSIITGHKIIISPSDISMGHHVSTPKNLITINNILEYTDGDNNAYIEAAKHNEYCYFIEFKIIPNCNIHGYYKHSEPSNYVNPFVFKANENPTNSVAI